MFDSILKLWAQSAQELLWGDRRITQHPSSAMLHGDAVGQHLGAQALALGHVPDLNSTQTSAAQSGLAWAHQSWPNTIRDTLPWIFWWILVFGFCGGFFVDFFGQFSLGKQKGKDPPKNPRFSMKLFDQNPLRENSALKHHQFRNGQGFKRCFRGLPWQGF